MGDHRRVRGNRRRRVPDRLIAGHFGTKVDTDRLQRWFAYLVFVVAEYVLVDTIVLR